MTNPIAVFGSINMDLVVYSSAKPKDGETIFGKNFEIQYPRELKIKIQQKEWTAGEPSLVNTY